MALREHWLGDPCRASMAPGPPSPGPGPGAATVVLEVVIRVPLSHPLSTLQFGHLSPKPPMDGRVLPWGPVPELHNPPGAGAGPWVHLNPLSQVSNPMIPTKFPIISPPLERARCPWGSQSCQSIQQHWDGLFWHFVPGPETPCTPIPVQVLDPQSRVPRASTSLGLSPSLLQCQNPQH